jgi:hypothetical protein
MSRDGTAWRRVAPGRYVFGRGGKGAWDRELVLPVAPVVHADRIWLYYTGFNIPYGLDAKDRAGEGWIENGERMQRAIGLATLRLDGFVALRAGKAAGVLETRDLRVAGDSLEVNAEVRGELRVEVQDPDGRAIPGYEAASCAPIRGDGNRIAVRWRRGATPAALRGRAVKLRITLNDGDLYAFGFR